ncbi:hypothetical protein NC653_004892 [Populus alba x Populus x berolinensis]|uniref:Uncharacterized protein n=1 Tax=Populus alba x Populus x berolinensis TaxID=444605 RepID=A0AAD6RAQ8_9ROSI|nr:hypothetical protein NC653_004892 [Populus alba x Populus x berolinensis]
MSNQMPYKESVLPAAVEARVSIEAGSTFGMGRGLLETKERLLEWTGLEQVLPAGKIYKEFVLLQRLLLQLPKKSARWINLHSQHLVKCASVVWVRE